MIKLYTLILIFCIESLSSYGACDLGISVKHKGIACYNGLDTIHVTIAGGTAPYSYKWGNNSTDSLLITHWGNVSVTVTDLNNCTASASITSIEPPELKLSFLSVEAPGCTGDTSGYVNMQGSGGTLPYMYTIAGISGENSIGVFSNLSAGDHSMKITDGKGCSKTVSFIIPKAIPDSFDVFVDSTTCIGSSDGSARISFRTIDNFPYQFILESDTTYSFEFFNLSAGVHFIQAINAHGCITEIPVIVPSSTAICTGIEEVGGKNEIRLYPNPATNVLSIELEDNYKTTLKLELRNLLGEVLYHAEMNSRTDKLDVSGMKTGLYTITMKDSGIIVGISKFIKE